MSRRPIANRPRPGRAGGRDLLARGAALAAGRREGGFFVLGGGARGEPMGRSAADGAAAAAGGGGWRDGPVKTKGRREGVSGAAAGAAA